MRRTFLAAVIAAVVVPVTPALAAESCPGSDLIPSAANAAQVRGATLCLVNAQRARHGLRGLRHDARLTQGDTRYAGRMVRNRFFSHVSPSGQAFTARIRRTGYLRGSRNAFLGENLAWGGGRLGTPRAIVRSWMNSPGHRANILRRGFADIGIGVALSTPVGVPGATYATSFGRRAAR